MPPAGICVDLISYLPLCVCMFPSECMLILILISQDPKSLDLSIILPSPLLSLSLYPLCGIRGSESTGHSKPNRPTGIELSPANPFVCFSITYGKQVGSKLSASAWKTLSPHDLNITLKKRERWREGTMYVAGGKTKQEK